MGTRLHTGPSYLRTIWPLLVFLICLAGLLYDTYVWIAALSAVRRSPLPKGEHIVTYIERTPTNHMSYNPIRHPQVSRLLTVGWFSDVMPDFGRAIPAFMNNLQ